MPHSSVPTPLCPLPLCPAPLCPLLCALSSVLDVKFTRQWQVFFCYFSSCCAACAPFYKTIMAFVPIGIALISFVILLLIRKRQTEYTPIPTETEPAASNYKNYGSINSDTPAKISNGSVNNQNSTLNTEQLPVTDSQSHTDGNVLHVPTDNLLPSSDHSTAAGSSPVKPSFIVGSTPEHN